VGRDADAARPVDLPPGWEDIPYAELTDDEEVALERILAESVRSDAAGESRRFDSDADLEVYLDSLGSATPRADD
jgi:hypothetical protein